MSKFNHMFDIAFALESSDADARDVTPDMLKAALLYRIESMSESEWSDACGLCDSYELKENF